VGQIARSLSHDCHLLADTIGAACGPSGICRSTGRKLMQHPHTKAAEHQEAARWAHRAVTVPQFINEDKSDMRVRLVCYGHRRQPCFRPICLLREMRRENQSVSRPEELHPRPLAELDVRLSLHPAPIRQTRRLCGFVFVACIASSRCRLHADATT